MKEFRDNHIKPGSFVLDVGGTDVNGSYRPLFSDCTYYSLDYEKADIVIRKGEDWPIFERLFDAVISGQTLEHDSRFWETLQSMKAALRPEGVLCLIVPSAGPLHYHPVDCYRFLPDCVTAWASWLGMRVLETRHLDVEPWRDLGFVLQREPWDIPGGFKPER